MLSFFLRGVLDEILNLIESVSEEFPSYSYLCQQAHIYMHIVEMNGWMTCDFTSFSTVFQSYQDDGWLIMKGYVQLSLFYGQ